MIQTNCLSKCYDSAQVLRDVTIQIKKHELAVIHGAYDSGKSTLLRCLSGLEEITHGSLEVNGITVDADMDSSMKYERMRQIRGRVSMVTMPCQLHPKKTAISNVIEPLFSLKHLNKLDAIELGSQMLDKVGMYDRRYAYPCCLTGSQPLRIMIARALAMNPDLLMIDETASWNDEIISQQLTKLISGLAQEGLTIVVAMSDIDKARKLSDRIYYLSEGTLSLIQNYQN